MVKDVSVAESPGKVAGHIARAAARLFAQRGYDATSVREIVEAAGVTKPTLYYHFGSKQALAEALLTRPMNRLIAQLRDLEATEPDPVERLRGIFRAKLDFLLEEPDRARFLYAICFGPQASTLQDEMHRFGEGIDAVTEACGQALGEAGIIDKSRALACAQAMRGLIMASTLDHLLMGRPLEPNLADRLVVDLLDGFGETPGKFEGERGNRR